MKGPRILARPSPRAKFKLGQRIAIKQPSLVRFGRIIGVEAKTADVRQICDNMHIVVVSGYRYRIWGDLSQGDKLVGWLDENMLETPVVEQVIERLRRGEI